MRFRLLWYREGEVGGGATTLRRVGAREELAVPNDVGDSSETGTHFRQYVGLSMWK